MPHPQCVNWWGDCSTISWFSGNMSGNPGMWNILEKMTAVSLVIQWMFTYKLHLKQHAACLQGSSKNYQRDCCRVSSSSNSCPCPCIKVCSKAYYTVQCHLPRHGWRLIQIPTVTMRQPKFAPFDNVMYTENEIS